MEKRKLGQTGLLVSALGFGGAEVGYSEAGADRVAEVLNAALDAGLNVIDTAECYLTSEETIGRAVGKRRNDFYLFTKCGHSNGYADPDWNDPQRLRKSLDRSLERLRTDHVDVLQLHSCSQQTLEAGLVVDFLAEAKKSGKTRFIGYSGEDAAAHYAVATGLFDTLQISVNIADQGSVDQIIPAAAKRRMGIIAKRPLANAAWKYKTKPDEYYLPYWRRLKRLDFEFLKDGSEQAVETALRFTLTVPGVSTAIVGTQKPGRWEENARIAAKGPLDRKSYDALRARWKEVAQPDWVGQV